MSFVHLSQMASFRLAISFTTMTGPKPCTTSHPLGSLDMTRRVTPISFSLRCTLVSFGTSPTVQFPSHLKSLQDSMSVSIFSWMHTKVINAHSEKWTISMALFATSPSSTWMVDPASLPFPTLQPLLARTSALYDFHQNQ